MRAHAAGTVPPIMLSSASPSLHREEDVADDGDPDAQREPVVHERRAGAPVEREQVEPLHDRSRAQHDDGGGGDERGVELLARVELAEHHARALALAEPPGVVAGPAVEAPEVGAQARAAAPEDREQQRDREENPRVHVDRADHLPVAHECGDRARVQGGAGEHQDPEQSGVHPVQRALAAVEPEEGRLGLGPVAPGRAAGGALLGDGHAPLRWHGRPARSNGRPIRRRRSRAPPSSPPRPLW